MYNSSNYAQLHHSLSCFYFEILQPTLQCRLTEWLHTCLWQNPRAHSRGSRDKDLSQQVHCEPLLPANMGCQSIARLQFEDAGKSCWLLVSSLSARTSICQHVLKRKINWQGNVGVDFLVKSNLSICTKWRLLMCAWVLLVLQRKMENKLLSIVKPEWCFYIAGTHRPKITVQSR